jgi:GntR family transcriptional repressor for pyruvate dehydrogenase complex
MLEMESAKLAAKKRTEEDIENIRAALNAFENQVETGNQGVEEDLLFHLQIAEASKNSVLKSLMLIIIPDVIKEFKQLEICKDGRYYKSLQEHKIIFNHIINQEPEKVAQAMKVHLSEVLEHSKQF